MLASVLPGLYYDAAEGTQVQWFLQVGSQDWGGEAFGRDGPASHSLH